MAKIDWAKPDAYVAEKQVLSQEQERRLNVYFLTALLDWAQKEPPDKRRRIEAALLNEQGLLDQRHT